MCEPLTPFEVRLLAGIAEGLTAEEQADSVRLTRASVSWYRWRIYSKLEARNAAHAVAIGFRDRLLS